MLKTISSGMDMQLIDSEMGAEHLRERAIKRLLDITSSDGVSFQLREHNGVLHYSGIRATSDMADYALYLDDRPHMRGSVTPDDPNASAVRSPYGDKTIGFRRFGEDRAMNSFLKSQVWRAFYVPFEITDHLRTMFYAEGEMIGYVAALRRGGDRFTEAEQAAANRLIPEIYDDLQLAWSTERGLRNDDSMHLVLDEHWNVLYASQSAGLWLTGRRRELLRALRQSTARRLVDGMHVTTSRLDSGNGLYYASLSMVSPVRQARWGELSASQQRIVDLATKGFTNVEIGRTLGISPATVKYHLSAAFGHLGVSSRTELARSTSLISD